MATDFKYASQSDLNRYVGDIVADADSKRQVYNWETTDTTHFYKSYNTGFISVLFFDGIEGTPVTDDPNANYEFRYSEGNDSVEVFINTDNPNDIVVEAGFDNTTYYDQILVDASMELNNLLDARYPTPLPKYDQYDANTTHSASTTEYDAIIIKMTCYIAASNALRTIGETEKADYYYDLVTNAEKTGMADRLNAGEFKLAFEVDSHDDKGKVRNISKAGSMDIVETAGEWHGEKYDVVRITCTTGGAYGTAIVKAETYGNDALFGTTTENIKVTGGLQEIVNGLYVRFQGASMNLDTTPDQWEVTITGSDRKLTNAQTGAIDLTRRGYSV
tara:strand:- start:761 stop:1756 length:996 start_codon:yes stop_codon:yes gene_type:complete